MELGENNALDAEQVLAQACAGTLYTYPEDPQLLPRLRQALLAAIDGAEELVIRPVENANKLQRRIRSDLHFLERCMGIRPPVSSKVKPANATAAQQPSKVSDKPSIAPDGEEQPTAPAAPPSSEVGALTLPTSGVPQPSAPFLTPARLQGLANNLRGHTGELLTAQAVPGLVALSKRFHAVPCQAIPAPGSAHEELVRARQVEAASRKRRQREAQQARMAEEEQQNGQQGAQEEVRGLVFAQETGRAEQPAVPTVPHEHSGSTEYACHAVNSGGSPAAAAHGEGHAGVAGDGDAAGTHQTVPLQTSEAAGSSQAEQPGNGKPGNNGGKGKQGKVGGAGRPDGLLTCAEVDVVCSGGSVWLEIKNQERFGLDSDHWTSTRGSVKGLKCQVEEMLAMAAAPCNHVRWQAPAVVVLFPSGADSLVVSELQRMGCTVLCGLDEVPHGLPPVPPEPTTTCLDTTTLCALVSHVSWARDDPRVAAWAARVPQWRDCLAAEAQVPIMQLLGRFITPDRPLVAADVAVQQFETLMALHGGPAEHARWEELRRRVRVVPTSPDQGEDAVISPRLQGLGTLRELGPQQMAVLSVGDQLRAVTLTANGSAVRSVQHQGMYVEAFVHRPVWLTGL